MTVDGVEIGGQNIIGYNSSEAYIYIYIFVVDGV